MSDDIDELLASLKRLNELEEELRLLKAVRASIQENSEAEQDS